MNLKTKAIISICSIIIILYLLPLIFASLANSQDGMGLMFISFFAINPILAIFLGAIAGTNVKKLWWIIPVFVLGFPLFIWIIFKSIIWELLIYSLGYLIIILIATLISMFFSKRANK